MWTLQGRCRVRIQKLMPSSNGDEPGDANDPLQKLDHKFVLVWICPSEVLSSFSSIRSRYFATRRSVTTRHIPVAGYFSAGARGHFAGALTIFKQFDGFRREAGGIIGEGAEFAVDARKAFGAEVVETTGMPRGEGFEQLDAHSRSRCGWGIRTPRRTKTAAGYRPRIRATRWHSAGSENVWRGGGSRAGHEQAGLRELFHDQRQDMERRTIRARPDSACGGNCRGTAWCGVRAVRRGTNKRWCRFRPASRRRYAAPGRDRKLSR